MHGLSYLEIALHEIVIMARNDVLISIFNLKAYDAKLSSYNRFLQFETVKDHGKNHINLRPLLV